MLDLLKRLCGEIYIPEAVWREVVVEGAGQPGAEEVTEADWIRRRSVHNVSLVHALRQDLDAGESETIALALELEADFLIMDERLGRDTARYFGLDFTGLIGVFIEAKHRGFTAQIKDYLDGMRDIAGFRIGNALYERVLTDEDEWEGHSGKVKRTGFEYPLCPLRTNYTIFELFEIFEIQAMAKRGEGRRSCPIST